jgi:hypothetical protein
VPGPKAGQEHQDGPGRIGPSDSSDKSEKDLPGGREACGVGETAHVGIYFVEEKACPIRPARADLEGIEDDLRHALKVAREIWDCVAEGVDRRHCVHRPPFNEPILGQAVGAECRQGRGQARPVWLWEHAPVRDV